MSYLVEQSQTLYVRVITRDSDGNRVAADALPTFKLWKDNVHDAAVTFGTATAAETGLYVSSCTIPAGYLNDASIFCTAHFAVSGGNKIEFAVIDFKINARISGIEASLTVIENDLATMSTSLTQIIPEVFNTSEAVLNDGVYVGSIASAANLSIVAAIEADSNIADAITKISSIKTDTTTIITNVGTVITTQTAHTATLGTINTNSATAASNSATAISGINTVLTDTGTLKSDSTTIKNAVLTTGVALSSAALTAIIDKMKADKGIANLVNAFGTGTSAAPSSGVTEWTVAAEGSWGTTKFNYNENTGARTATKQ